MQIKRHRWSQPLSDCF